MIKVVPKIVALLELFSDGSEYGFAELVARTGYTRSNVAHLLQSLCECGAVTRTGYGAYRRGERLIRWSGGGDRRRLLNEIAGRCAGQVVGLLNELGVVALRYRGSRLTLAKCRPEKSLRIETPDAAGHYPADWFSTAGGRVLLAWAGEEEVTTVLRRCGLPERRVWPRATSLPKLSDELKRIRDAGYVSFPVDDEVRVFGVPAEDAAGERVFSVSTALPIFSPRFSEAEIVEKLTAAAESMSKELHFHGLVGAELDLYQ